MNDTLRCADLALDREDLIRIGLVILALVTAMRWLEISRPTRPTAERVGLELDAPAPREPDRFAVR